MTESQRPKTALVVEDEPSVLALIRHTLESDHWYVVTAMSHQDALQALAECSPDLLVLELSLADGDGTDLLHEARQRNLQAPALFLIDSPAEATGAQLEVLGGTHICRPVDAVTLRTVVALLTDQPRSQTERRRMPRSQAEFAAEVRSLGDRGDYAAATVESLSHCGAGVITEGKFHIGQDVELRLRPPFPHRPIALHGRVNWWAFVTPEEHRIGLSFPFSNAVYRYLQEVSEASV